MNTILYPSELLAAQEPIPFHVDGLLPMGALGMLWAPSGIGKTFVCLDLCLHIAAGRTWQGRAVTQGGVLYVVGEGFSGMPQRVGAWCAEHAIDPAALDGWVGFRRVSFDVSDDEVRAAVRDEMASRALRPSLVVLDTLSANAPVGFDESKTAAMKLLLDGARALRDEHGCSVLLIHHTGWDESRERGSSDLRGAMDVSLSLRSQGGEVRELRVEKARDFSPPDPIRLALRARHGARVVESASSDPQSLAPSQRQVLSVLAENRTTWPLRARDWQTRSGFGRSQFFQIKNELTRLGYVECDAKGRATLTATGESIVTAFAGAANLSVITGGVLNAA